VWFARSQGVLCDPYQCLFVHIPKTAGQSVEHVFLDLLGLTWDGRAPLLLRHNDNPDLGPPRLAHLKAADYVRCGHVTQAQFDAYYKFAFVRDPWDRVVSMYRYFGFSTRLDFKPFLMKTFAKDIWHSRYWFVGPQYEYLYDQHGACLVDFVGRFERLQTDFDWVGRRLGLPTRTLPHVNGSADRDTGKPPPAVPSATTRPSDRTYYDDESAQFVAELYHHDIDLFSYRFA
jgi:hypothetical protein